MTIPGLTVKERILLHLFDYNRFADAYEAPLEVTQTGIAEAVGTRASHIAQYLKPLLAEGEIQDGTSRIVGKPRRRKVYFLTIKGRRQVASLRNTLLREKVPFRRRSGEFLESPLSRIYQEERRGVTLLELLEELASNGHIVEAMETAPRGLVDFSQEAPRIERFYGRKGELEEALRALESVPLVVVTGMAGIGKTAIGSRICDLMRGKRSVLWRRIRPWDSANDLAWGLADFLKSMGRTHLHAFLSGSAPKELRRMEQIAASELAEANSLLVFDDVHIASRDAEFFLAMLYEAVKTQQGTSALLLSRTVPGFYNPRDTAVEGLVAEFSLKGLDPDSSRSLLVDEGVANVLVSELAEASGGSPLFLKILARAHPQGIPEEGWNTLETYIAVEVEPSLTDAERVCLEAASLYEVPVHGGNLLLEESGGIGTIIGLQRKGLLDELATGRFLLHDFLRRYFREGLPAQRKEVLVGQAVPRLLEETEKAANDGRPKDAIAFLENAVIIDHDRDRRLSSLERLVDLRTDFRDHLGARESCQRALKEVEDSVDEARLRGKMGFALLTLGQLDKAEEELHKGLELLPPEPSLEAGWLLSRMAWVDVWRKNYAKALERIELAMSWMSKLPQDPRLLAWLAITRGNVYLYDPRRRDPRFALNEFQTSIKAVEETDDDKLLSICYLNLSLAAFAMGQVDQAFGHLDRVLDLGAATGHLPQMANGHFVKGYYLAECVGDYESAETLYNKAYRIAKEADEPYRLIWFYPHFADLLWRQDHPEGAREALEHFLQAGGNSITSEARVQHLALMTRLSLACGDEDAAEATLKELHELAQRTPSDAKAYFLEWASGAFYAFKGSQEKSEASFEHALGLETPRLGASITQEYLATEVIRGELLLDYGRILGSTGRERRARAVLLEAQKEFERLGRRPLEQTAREAIESLSPT